MTTFVISHTADGEHNVGQAVISGRTEQDARERFALLYPGRVIGQVAVATGKKS